MGVTNRNRSSKGKASNRDTIDPWKLAFHGDPFTEAPRPHQQRLTPQETARGLSKTVLFVSISLLLVSILTLMNHVLSPSM